MTPFRAVLASLFAVYLVAGIWTTRRTAATGDEPYYFMAADALIRGEGLDLTARWLDLERAPYGPGVAVPLAEFERSTAPSRVRAGHYPLHDLGLPLLIALPFALGGRALVVSLIALAMAGAAGLGARAAEALGASPRLATAAALAVGLSAPALTYSGQAFPDAAAALPLALALCALVGALPRWLLGPAVATLPLLHLRLWPLALALLVASALTQRPTRREAVFAVAPVVAVVVSLSLLDLVIYGAPVPHAGFLLFFLDRPEARLATFTRPPGEGLLGIFGDRAFGLLPAAPILGLIFVGAGCALRSRGTAVLAALAVPYLVAISILDWTGGFSPQARYLAVLVPLFVPLLALALAWRPVLVAAVPLGVWTVGQSLVYVVAPWLRYNSYGLPPLADTAWARFVGVVPSGVFPLFGTDGSTGVLALATAALLLGLLLFGWRFARHERVTHRPEHRTAWTDPPAAAPR